jgi:hypothetical protein
LDHIPSNDLPNSFLQVETVTTRSKGVVRVGGAPTRRRCPRFLVLLLVGSILSKGSSDLDHSLGVEEIYRDARSGGLTPRAWMVRVWRVLMVIGGVVVEGRLRCLSRDGTRGCLLPDICERGVLRRHGRERSGRDSAGSQVV